MIRVSTVIIGGMTCGSCVSSITSVLNGNFQELDPDFKCTISLLTETGVIEYNDALVELQAIVEAIQDCGFDCEVARTEEKPDSQLPQNNDSFRTEISIGGMTCGACVSSVTQVLENLDGVTSVTVSLLTENGVILHSAKISTDLIKETVEDCGFDCDIIKTEPNVTHTTTTANGIITATSTKDDIETVNLRIFGMTCSSCSSSIENVVSQLDGILSCKVALVTEVAQIKFNSDRIGIRDIIAAIEDCGFDAIINNSLDNTSQIELLSKVKDIQFWKANVIQLFLFGSPVFFLGHILPMAYMLSGHMHKLHNIFGNSHNIYWETTIQFILSTYIQFALGKRFYINSYKGLKHGSGSMDLLISISTTTLYIYSAITLVACAFRNTQCYPDVLFDTSAMLFFFVSIGKWVESKSKGSTSTALSRLLSLTPSSCTIIEGTQDDLKNINNEDITKLNQKTISVDLLQKNDIVVILPGSRIPTDGTCIFGNSEVDESLLTGESKPVLKFKGANLIGGSVNTTSTLYMKVEKLGENTQLQKIVKLVRDAQISKIPIQRFADKIASMFVPTIIFLSSMTFIGWFIYVHSIPLEDVPKFFKNTDDASNIKINISKIVQVAISVVVVACPCALGLAAPTAIMVGTGVGATNGILIKGGEILENGNAINCVVFDKTGTITKGKMKLINYKFLPNKQIYGDNELLIWDILQRIEKNSEHPVGKSIAKYANYKLNTSSESESQKDKLVSKIFDLDIIVGSGVNATIIDSNGNTLMVKIGTSQLITSSKIDNLKDFNNCLEEINHKEQISSISHIVINDYYIGYLELADSLKKDVKRTIATLLDMGYSVGMVTGDNAKTARYIASKIGIPLSNVLSEAKPNEKIEFVSSLQENLGLRVAFVGDGINDAPALMKADLGVAIATGTDIAIDAADIVLLSSTRLSSSSSSSLQDLHQAEEDEDEFDDPDDDDDQLSTSSDALHSGGIGGVVAALSISKATFQSIKSNFFFAVLYNIILLPISMGLLIIPFGITMHPMFAGAAMASSSITVVLNSLRLKNWRVSFVEPSNALFWRYNININATSRLNPVSAPYEFDLEHGSNDVLTTDVTHFQIDNFTFNKGKGAKIPSFLSRNTQSFTNYLKTKLRFGGSRLQYNTNSYEMLPSTSSV